MIVSKTRNCNCYEMAREEGIDPDAEGVAQVHVFMHAGRACFSIKTQHHSAAAMAEQLRHIADAIDPER